MAPGIQISDFREHGVRLISPEALEFDSLARPRIGEEADVVLAQLMPYLVAVVNESSRAIVGLEILWLLEVEGHEGGTLSRLRYPEGVFRASVGRYRPIMPGDVRIVPPGEMVVENWPREANHVLKHFRHTIAPERIVIKTMIFEDGLMLEGATDPMPGFGLPSLEDHFQGSLDVRREWYARTLRDLEGGRTDADVLAAADELLGESNTFSVKHALLEQDLRETAEEIRVLLEKGREAGIESLRLAVSRPQFELRRG